MAEALQHNQTLTLLDLSDNHIKSEGASAIGRALQHNHTLTTLMLRGNQIGYEGALAIGQALHHNSTLTTLNLYNNMLGDEGARAIIETLYHNSTLTTIDQLCNQLRDTYVVCRMVKSYRRQMNNNHLAILIGTRDPNSLIYQLPHDNTILRHILHLAKVSDCEIYM